GVHMRSRATPCVHETQPVVDIEQTNVHPEWERDLLLFLAFDPELPETGAVAQHLAVGVEIAEDAGRFEHRQRDAAEEEQLLQCIVILRQYRVVMSSAEA